MHGDPGSPLIHLDEELCLDLVAGLLPADRARAALEHAARCERCEDTLRQIAATHERGVARAAGVLVPGRRPSSRASRFAWPAAAAVLILAGAIWWSMRPSIGPNPGPSPRSVRLPNVDFSRLSLDRSGGVGDSTIFQGIDAYQRGDFSEAARRLAAAEGVESLELLRRIYLAGAQIETGLPAEALTTLRGVRPADVPEPWRGESEWIRMLAWFRTGHVDSAESLLTELGRGVGPVAERSRKLQAERRSAP